VLTIVGATAVLLKVYFMSAGKAHFPLKETEVNGQRHSAIWTVDPLDAGALLPPGGRSLFDYLVTQTRNGETLYDVPFPFAALVRKIATRAGNDMKDSSPFRRVLIPLGRSLQRSAGAPEFFKYPRAVVAADAEPPVMPAEAGRLLKDRLYLGYHEKAGLIEVISYNEEAGRFEFQIVRDYREGGTPQVLYANRILCVSCHRNQAPIFSRQLWDETNGNKDIAAELKAARRDFYQFPTDGGIDVPNAIDNAVERANRFAATQLLWREGCENEMASPEAIACRAAILTSMLQYRLSGERFFDTRSARYREDFIGSIVPRWRKRWPQGLQLPDPSIANRKLKRQDDRLLQYQPTKHAINDWMQDSDVVYPFDPLNPRAALEVWNLTETDHRDTHRAITGLAEFVTSADVRRLDDYLFAQGQRSGRRNQYQSACALLAASGPRSALGSTAGIKFRCDSNANGETQPMSLQGRIRLERGRVLGGSIDSLVVNGSPPLRDMEILPAPIEKKEVGVSANLAMVQKLNGLHARLPDGNAIELLTLRWDAAAVSAATFPGRVEITTLEDFAPVHKAISEMARRTRTTEIDALSKKPFRRSVAIKELFARLGMPPMSWCCEDHESMPPAVAEGPPKGATQTTGAGESPVDKFYHYCATCHAMKDSSPANFLHGEPRHARERLAHCAERIFFRLEMARIKVEQRVKSPMPPLRAIDSAKPDGTREEDLVILRDYVASIVREKSGEPPSIEALMARGYWRLPSCLPEENQQKVARAN
jgi:hypothetical protein